MGTNSKFLREKILLGIKFFPLEIDKKQFQIYKTLECCKSVKIMIFITNIILDMTLGTPKTINFPFVPWKISGFQVSQYLYTIR